MPPPAAEPTKRAHDEADRLAGIDGDDSDKKRPAKINRTLSGSPAAASRMGPSHPAAVHGNHTNFTVDASMRQAWQPVQQALPGQRHPMATKLEKLTGYGTTVKGTFELNKVLTHQLTALRSSKSENVDIVDMGDFCEPLFCYNNLPTEKKEFMLLALPSSNLYIRSGYQALYDAVCEAWESGKYRVCLIGSAGTGKSLFQLYALRQLLVNQEGRDYDFVIRQVGTIVLLIDLSDASVYKWSIQLDDMELLSIDLHRTLYFFEPGNDAETSPVAMRIASLSTLSPYEKKDQRVQKVALHCTVFLALVSIRNFGRCFQGGISSTEQG